MAGRPKMTEAQKEAARQAREDAKANAGAKADKAEARAGGRAGSFAAPKPQSTANTDDLDREEKALFLNIHLPEIKRLRALLLTANSNLRGAYKKALAEGNFTKADFDTAIAVETAENEARERAAIARKLRIAQIMGSDLGAQLDMFLEPVRVPAVDRAFEEGERCSMENKAANPPYDPSTDQYRKFMEGFHAHQATIAKGIKPTNPAGTIYLTPHHTKASNPPVSDPSEGGTGAPEILLLVENKAAIRRMAVRLFEAYRDELEGVPLSTMSEAESLLREVLLSAISK